MSIWIFEEHGAKPSFAPRQHRHEEPLPRKMLFEGPKTDDNLKESSWDPAVDAVKHPNYITEANLLFRYCVCQIILWCIGMSHVHKCPVLFRCVTHLSLSSVLLP